jgi:hypothetical protein
MNRNYLLSFASIAVTALALAGEGKAQILSPTSQSNSNAGAVSGSNSGSTSNSRAQTGPVNAQTGPVSAQTGTTAASGSSSLGFTQNSNSTNINPNDVTIRSAPQVYVPSVVTGNVCALGASGGASFIGTGFAIGASWESEQCENRQRVALLHNMGYKDAAREVACDTRVIYEGMKRAGTPCLVRPEWEPKGAVVVSSPQPLPVGPAAPPVQVTSRPRFNPALYATGSECLNAAQVMGAPYSECRGKP